MRSSLILLVIVILLMIAIAFIKSTNGEYD